MPLTDTTVRTAKAKGKQYKLSDSAGLYLLVKPNGKKYWRLKYYFVGKEKLLSIGVYPVVSLSEAREKSLLAKKQLSNSIDPSEHKKEQKLKNSVNAENSFKNITIEWHNNQKQGWTERHAVYVLRRIEADVFPALASRPINEIKAPELLAVLRLIETRGAIDIAHRVLHKPVGRYLGMQLPQEEQKGIYLPTLEEH
ncbi:DUF4102 family integrase N-terminal domain protein [Candidatus Megaera polyxenophila]|nr:DUF4102 family integrase N-terminal domain protein [Candidatus Megaera polyxenophila]